MKITMLHYHLRPGGITTVIRNAQKALAGRATLRRGRDSRTYATERVLPVEVLADFGYHDDPRTFHRLVRAYLRQLPRTGILHTHNIGLGKNPALSSAVRQLADTGVRILNQVHDFPEDNRPAQLRALRQHRDWQALCYYDLPNVRWATLTSHDADRLAARGIPKEKITVLPNPIDTAFFKRPCRVDARPVIAAYAAEHGYRFDPRKKIILAPVKVMVRKNNAEAVELIKHLPGYQLIISLDASSPRDQAYSAKLKRLVRRAKLPVIIGCGAAFADPLPLFHAAHAILTTSTQEGFGYTFLEGWLAGKLVVGRDLPEVTKDFHAAGVHLDHLYRVPDPVALRRLLARPDTALIAHNRRVVQRQYSLAAYARRLRAIYAQF
ncbi:MAG: Mannosylglucosyl-3-phosphoglycerate synthase [Verrucomicrobiae bacterium]|nr:Mannosylglucosyl-3-phosphoglycerate synthase [Verrucomicrobiae bacterium]